VRAAVGVAVGDDGRILAVASDAELRAAHPTAAVIDCGQGVLTPGFVDSHTHAIFGRARYEEQEMRAAGVGYLEIAKRGGGIHSSVRDLRTRSEADLAALAAAPAAHRRPRHHHPRGEIRLRALPRVRARHAPRHPATRRRGAAASRADVPRRA
jgi:imidazolonepropionase-like amidohydrolase